MWEPLNKSALPSSKDPNKEPENILENTLELPGHMALQFDGIENEAERRARIAPVLRAPFEVLSAIFEYCSEIDWTTPLDIAAVCRDWREIILQTPRAWCFIDLGGSVKECWEIYLVRSGEYSLHISLWGPSDISHITSITHRIRCMAIASLPDDMGDLCFPELLNLRFTLKSRDCADPSTITTSSFPRLRHLQLHNVLTKVHRCPEMPPIQTLEVSVHDNDGWPEAIQACSASLRSLKVILKAWCGRVRICRIHLPELSYFRVINQRGGDHTFPWELGTPSLKAYIEADREEVERGTMHRNVESVTHMRLERLPAQFMPNHLRVLQLKVTPQQCRDFVDEMESAVSDYPYLELLEFNCAYMASTDTRELEGVFDRWRVRNERGRGKQLKINGSWSCELPDDFGTEGVYNQSQCPAKSHW